MKRMMLLLLMAVLAWPTILTAKGKSNVNEYGEIDSPDDEAYVEDIASVKKITPKKVQEFNLSEVELAKAPKPKKPSSSKPIVIKNIKSSPIPSGPSASERDGRFRVGILAPGIAAFNKGLNPLFSAGAEGEYFFYEKLSAGLKINVATKLTNSILLSFIPQARYTFDFDNYPRWAVYAQAGAGVAVAKRGNTKVAADIAIPGGGGYWQWTDNISVGADLSMHILVGGGYTAVGVVFSPAIRYIF